MRKIVIIGNGISGVTCARHIRKQCDDDITIISAETKHFYSRTALMYIYMGHMKYEHTKPYEDFFWEKNRLALVQQKVLEVKPSVKRLIMERGSPIAYDLLILACGSVTKKYNWPGQDLKGVRGLYSFQDLESMEAETKGIRHAVITGGGLIGVEMAEMLHSRKIPVTMLIKDKYYWASVLPEPDARLVSRQIIKNGINLVYESELKEIRGDAQGRVNAVVTSASKLIDCDFVGIATGVSPNISFLKDSGLRLDKGILVNEYFETNEQDIYSIGDCAQMEKPMPGRKPIEQVWYTGRIQGETLAQTICGKRTAYRPGPWFNSAKFFDLEYQTYGLASSKLEEGETYFYWEHPKRPIGFGAVYHSGTKELKGVNSYGMRLKHILFDQWLSRKATIDNVLENLHKASFDPEFAKNHVKEIVRAYNRQTGSSVKGKKRWSGLF